MKKTIVTIGGGANTLEIDKKIVELTGKSQPNFLFIPTASSDHPKYIEMMKADYATKLGCKFETLLLISEKPSLKEIQQKISNADIIYVGGGNTLKMMRLWRRLGVDKMLKKAYEKGTIMCGLSAGSICWYEGGHSDSMSYYNPEKWEYIRVTGLGFIKGTHCPHFDSETLGIKRRDSFISMMKKHPGIGLAVDDHAAILFQDDQYKVLSCKKGAGAYKLFKSAGVVKVEKIQQKNALLSLKLLY